MIDKIINLIFRWERLREAIFDEVHMYDEIVELLNDKEAMEINSKYWKEGDTWYSWRYNKEFNRYYFDDYGYKSISSLLDMSGEL